MTSDPIELPDSVELVRTTAEFDEGNVPPGLLDEHRIAAGVWGRLVVSAGSIRFVFDDDRHGPARVLAEGSTQVIPPEVPHHVELVGPTRFHVEFHR